LNRATCFSISCSVMSMSVTGATLAMSLPP
jgi:hypothetical protein